MKSRKRKKSAQLQLLYLFLSERIVFSDVFEIVRSSYKLNNVARWLATSESRKYLQDIDIVTKNIIDFINGMAFFFSRLICRSEEKRRSDIGESFWCETGFSDAETNSFVVLFIEERIFIAKIITYSTNDSKREFIGTKKIYLSWCQYALVEEIVPSRYENSERFTFFSSFELIEHFISFTVIESTS
jgi:hypothetical protein